MFVIFQTRSILFYVAAILPLTAVLLIVTSVYAACPHTVPVNIECQTNLPDNNCSASVNPPKLCSQDTKFDSALEGDFGRAEEAGSNEDTNKTTAAEDEQNCYKYYTCKHSMVIGCVQDQLKIAKAPVYKSEKCP